MIPCKECLVVVRCKKRDTLYCDILYDYLADLRNKSKIGREIRDWFQENWHTNFLEIRKDLVGHGFWYSFTSHLEACSFRCDANGKVIEEFL